MLYQKTDSLSVYGMKTSTDKSKVMVNCNGKEDLLEWGRA